MAGWSPAVFCRGRGDQSSGCSDFESLSTGKAMVEDSSCTILNVNIFDGTICCDGKKVHKAIFLQVKYPAMYENVQAAVSSH